jgi:hypothetical protein
MIIGVTTTAFLSVRKGPLSPCFDKVYLNARTVVLSLHTGLTGRRDLCDDAGGLGFWPAERAKIVGDVPDCHRPHAVFIRLHLIVLPW